MTKLSELRELLAKATSRYDDEVIKEFMPEADLLLDLWEACLPVRDFVNGSGYKGVIWDKFNDALIKLNGEE